MAVRLKAMKRGLNKSAKLKPYASEAVPFALMLTKPSGLNQMGLDNDPTRIGSYAGGDS